MKDFGLFSERDAQRAERRLNELTRFAERREQYLENVDLDSLDRGVAFDILAVSYTHLTLPTILRV